MHPLSDEELHSLIADIESDRVERKEAWAGSAPQKGREAICAFANDLSGHDKPGILIIGVRDDGLHVGPDFKVTDELLLTLAAIKTDGKITPPPSLNVEKRQLLGGEVAVVTVWPSDAPPVRLDGRILVRTGPRRGYATAQDERILSEKRRYKDRVFDGHPISGAGLTDLNKSYFEDEYLPSSVARDVLDANGRSYEARLASLGMIASVEDPTPTVAGLLVLGVSARTWIPSAYVQFLRIRGVNLADPVSDEQEIDGNIETIVRRLDEKIKANISISIDFTSGLSEEIRSPDYPLSAIQQLTRNALMHRTYEGTNAPIRVYWFDDRIEITNPGGPFGVVTTQNFGNPGISDYRNPLLASAIKNLGFVQRFGFGIAESRRAMADNGNPPPEFTVDQSNILVTLRK